MKRLASIVAAIIAVSIVAVALVSLLLPADVIKAQVLAQLGDVTGHKLTVKGPLSLQFFPTFKLAASDVTIAGAPWAQSSATVRIKELDIAVKLLPLLSRRIEIERLVLVAPALVFELAPPSLSNRQSGESAAADRAPAPVVVTARRPAMTALAALSRLGAEYVAIEDGDIVVVDRGNDRRYELQQIAATLAAPHLGVSLAAEGDAMWRGQKIAFSMTLDQGGALLRPGGKSHVVAALQSTPLTAKFVGEVASGETGGPGALVLDGNADLATPSVRDLATWSDLDIDLPKRGFGALAVSGVVRASAGSAQFTNATFSLDTTRATGTVTLSAGSNKPRIAGALRIDRLDFNPYLGPSTPGWSTETLDPRLLRQLDAELTIDASSVRYRKLQSGATTAKVNLEDDKLRLSVGNVALYHGSAKGIINLDCTTDIAAVTVDGSISAVDIGPLLRDAGGGGSIRGTASFTLSGTAHGNSQRDLISTLSGSSSFRLAHGSLGGIDLAGMLMNTAAAFASGSGATAIERASASNTIRNGIMSSSNLVATIGAVEAHGTGTVNLPQRTLSYRVEPKIMAGIVTVPVIVSGRWDHLSFQPDVAGIAKGIVSAPVKVIGGAANGVSKVGQGIGGALKSLFGN
jgi:AsmA protein